MMPTSPSRQPAARLLRRVLAAVLFAAVMPAGDRADAATLIYDDAVSGDLGANFSFASPSPLFVVHAAGTNSVAGSRRVSTSPTSGTVVDNDVFFVEVPTGLRISALTLSVSNAEALNTGPDSYLSFAVFDENGILFSQQLDALTEALRKPSRPFETPLEAGRYRFNAAGASLMGTAPTKSIRTDYLFTFETETVAVSLPATLTLLAAGLSGLHRRRPRVRPRSSRRAAASVPAQRHIFMAW